MFLYSYIIVYVMSVSTVKSNSEMPDGDLDSSAQEFGDPELYFKREFNDMINSVVVNGIFGQHIKLQTNYSTEYLIEYLYNASLLNVDAIRITVYCPDSVSTYPVIVVVRQQKGVLSWQLPLEPPVNSVAFEEYNAVSRTLCPAHSHRNGRSGKISFGAEQRLFIDISTSSPDFVDVFILAKFINFTIGMNQSKTFLLTPSKPVFYRFQFPDDVEVVLVKALSDDDFCAIVAIQNLSCPIFDTEDTVTYADSYQSMTSKAGITVTKERYPKGFYIIAVALTSDEVCAGKYLHILQERRKTISLIIVEKITDTEYLAAILAGLGFCASFYVVTLVLRCITFASSKKKGPLEPSSLWHPVEVEPTPSSSSGPVISVYEDEDREVVPHVPSDSSLDEDEIDMLEDAESDKDIFRTKTFLYVSDLARKRPAVLRRKSNLYISSLITVGIYYAVPVVQLVVTYQKVLDETGNQDTCFYNFWCAHPLGPLSDFNHVYSNVSYIFLGLLFIAVCLHRQQSITRQASKLEKYYGMPQHYGIFYAMGGAIIVEGLMSACYHLCPNSSNFQFDTSFMYVIAVLYMLKIYQTRHPDISASASMTYLALSFAVLTGVIGVLANTRWFWIIFGLLHIIICLILSAYIYYMGRWSFDAGLVQRMLMWCRSEFSDVRHLMRPMYCDRMVLLLFGNFANWALAVYGMMKSSSDFASFLLIIFLMNLLLYTTFYIIMKLRHGERILIQPLVYLVLCFLILDSVHAVLPPTCYLLGYDTSPQSTF